MPPSAAVLEELLPELSRLLWKQRDLVAVLEYRLEVQQLFMVAARAERITMAVGEVEQALAAIREIEARRQPVVSQCARALGLPATATLTQICAAAPEPWSFVLADHQQSFLALVKSTESLSSLNRELASRALGEAQDTLGQVSGAPVSKTYGRKGDQSALRLPPTLVDRAV